MPGERRALPVCGGKACGTVRRRAAAVVGAQGPRVRDLFWQPKNFNLVLQHRGPCGAFSAGEYHDQISIWGQWLWQACRKRTGGAQIREDRPDRRLIRE